MLFGNRFFHAFLWLIFLITALFLAAPLIMLLVKGMAYVLPCLKSPEVRFAIGLSLKTTLISTLICMVLAIPTAVFMHRHRFKCQRLVMLIMHLPMALPHLVSGIALLLLFGKMGIGGWLYETLGLDFVFTVNGIVLAQTFVNLPFTVQMLYTALSGANDRMTFIARTLGCTEFQAFRHVLLPNLKRGMVSAAIMTWSRALGEFGAVIMVAGTTRMKTEILPTAIYLNMATGDLDLAIGISLILIIISLLCIFVFELLTHTQSSPT